jgi:hypothetical protein
MGTTTTIVKGRELEREREKIKVSVSNLFFFVMT